MNSQPTITDRIVSRLSRVTSGGSLIPEIDGLRFVAVLGVFLYHVQEVVNNPGTYHFAHADPTGGPIGQWMTQIMSGGWTGVRLFFMISGFILALPFARYHMAGGKHVGLGRYFKRRVLRIEPPYLICLIILFASQVARFGTDWFGKTDHLLATMFYMHNTVFSAFSPINVVAWSLEVEVQFYLMAPLLAMVFKIQPAALRRGFLLVSIAAFAIAAHLVEPQLSEASRFRIINLLPFHLHYFLVGFLLVDLFISRPPAERGSLVCDALAVLGLIGMFLFPAYTPLRDYGIVLAVGLLGLGTLWGSVWRTVMRNRWIVVAGGMCYTIYLYHFTITKALAKPLLNRVNELPQELQILLLAALTFPAVYLIGSMLFVAFEKPFMYRDWHTKLYHFVTRSRTQPNAVETD